MHEKADEDIEKYGLDISFKDVSDLYLEVDNSETDLKEWLEC